MLQRFQHTAARRRLPKIGKIKKNNECFNTQPREGGCRKKALPKILRSVSTHSRAKAAAKFCHQAISKIGSFNTQPREGGCRNLHRTFSRSAVSTHSRAKAAAECFKIALMGVTVSTHSRAKAAAIA